MLRSRFTVLFLVLATTCPLAADEEFVNIDASFPKNQVPSALAAGDKVALVQVLGSSVTKDGKVHLTTAPVAAGLEVTHVLFDEKPKESWKAVKVTFKVSPATAKKIKAIQSRTVTVTTVDSQGNQITSQRPIPMRIEVSKQ